MLGAQAPMQRVSGALGGSAVTILHSCRIRRVKLIGIIVIAASVALAWYERWRARLPHSEPAAVD